MNEKGAVNFSDPADPKQDYAAPKKRELPSRKNTNVRNLVWAIGLNLVIVVLVAAVIVGVGRNDRDLSSSAQSQINLGESAQRASESLGFEALRVIPENWHPTKAQIESLEPKIWSVKYSSSEERLVSLLQSDADFALLEAKLPGTLQVIEGESLQLPSSCQLYELLVESNSPTKAQQRAVACALKDSNFIAYGVAEEATLLELVLATPHVP